MRCNEVEVTQFLGGAYMELTIRNISEEDIPQVVDIQVEGWKAAYKGIIDDEFLKSMDKEKQIERRKADYKQGNFIVAEIEGEIVGFCRFSDIVLSNDSEKFDCELMALYVKPELKQQGIGKIMFNYVVNDLKGKEKSKMILWCLKENYPSRAFYEKMGGIIVGEHEIEIGDKTYQEVGFGYSL
jgi:ribosomal protein S18 acetylase RimI-like enzyme